MNGHIGRSGSGGRLQLPLAVRRELGLVDGDQILMRVVDGEVRVRPRHDRLKRIQVMLRPYAAIDRSVVDDLIADRRAEAERD